MAWQNLVSAPSLAICLQLLEALGDLRCLPFFRYLRLLLDLVIIWLNTVSSELPDATRATSILSRPIMVPILLPAICGLESLHLRGPLDDLYLGVWKQLLIVETLVYYLVLAFITIVENVAVIYLIVVRLFGFVTVHLVALIDLWNIAWVDVTVLLLVNKVRDDWLVNRVVYQFKFSVVNLSFFKVAVRICDVISI